MSRILLFVVCFAALSGPLCAADKKPLTQTPPTVAADEKPYLIVDTMPRFRSGNLGDFRKWAEWKLSVPEGQSIPAAPVTLSFVVRNDGTVTDVKVEKSSGSAACDQAAVDVVAKSPRWKPGVQDGNAVSVKFLLPLGFRQ